VDTEPLLRVKDVDSAAAAAALARTAPDGRQWLVRLVVPTSGLRAAIGVEVFRSAAEAVRVGYDPVQQTFFVDRTTRTPEFAGQSERHAAARLLDGPEVSMEVWTDGSTLELFADAGTVVISDLVYADPAATGVALFHGAENPPLRSLELHSVRAALYRPAP
jgi:fructan beta-fructosidase